GVVVDDLQVIGAARDALARLRPDRLPLRVAEGEHRGKVAPAWSYGALAGHGLVRRHGGSLSSDLTSIVRRADRASRQPLPAQLRALAGTTRFSDHRRGVTSTRACGHPAFLRQSWSRHARARQARRPSWTASNPTFGSRARPPSRRPSA